MPEIVTGRPQYGRWAPKLALALWTPLIPAWILFYACLAANGHHPVSHSTLSIYGFYLMRAATVLLFFTGLIILAIEAVSHALSLRRYRQEEQALAASTSVHSSPRS